MEEKRKKETSGWLAGNVPAFGVILLNADECFYTHGVIVRLGQPPAAPPADDPFFDISFRLLIPVRDIPSRPLNFHWLLRDSHISRSITVRLDNLSYDLYSAVISLSANTLGFDSARGEIGGNSLNVIPLKFYLPINDRATGRQQFLQLPTELR